MSSPADPLNVLLIITDQHRFDALGANGNRCIQTPHLDAFASTAVNFQQHRISTPLCTPSRASLMTGQYGRTHGAASVGHSLNRQVETLGHWLQKAGLATGFFGKCHLEPETSDFNASVEVELRDYYGFDTARLSEDNLCGPYMRWLEREHPEWVAAAWDQANEGLHQPPKWGRDADGRLRASYATSLPAELSQSTWITRQTEAFIETQTRANQPFFAVCSYVPPHHPWTPPSSCMERYNPASIPVTPCTLPGHDILAALGLRNDASDLSDGEMQRLKAAYYALCSHLDDCIGQLLKTLEATGASSRTIVIFTSDHGDHLGDHGLLRKTSSLFDELLHVPLLMRVPGSGVHGVSHRLTQHEDIAPTVLDLLGAPIPRSCQGISFASAFGPDDHSGPAKSSSREFQFFEYQLNDRPYARVGVGDSRYKLIRYHPEPGWVLIDRETDPAELHNLADSPVHASAEQRLRGALFEWLATTGLLFGPKPYIW